MAIVRMISVDELLDDMDIEGLRSLLMDIIGDNEKEAKKEPKKETGHDFSLSDILPEMKVTKILPKTKYFGEDEVKTDAAFDRNLFDVYREIEEKEKEALNKSESNIDNKYDYLYDSLRYARSPKTEEKVKYMDFSEALKAVKSSKKIARRGWNGKDMFIMFVDKGEGGMCKLEKHKVVIAVEPHFLIKNANNTYSTWVPSVGDILANDWYIVK